MKIDFRLEDLSERKGLLILFFLIIVTSLFLFRDFIFGKQLLIYRDIGSDTFYSYYRYYYFLIDQIRQGEFSFWSFKMGIGTSVLSLFPLLYEPFFPFYLLFGVDKLSVALTYVFILKIALAGYFSYLYFTYMKVGVIPAIMCSLLYAFNGYIMLWGQHYYFSSGVVFLPLVIYALERFLQERKWGLLLFSISLVSLNIYFFYQIVIFFVIYYLLRCWFDPNIRLKKNVLNTGRLAVISLLGIGLSAVFIMPEYYLLQSNPRISKAGIQAIFDVTPILNTKAYYFSLIARLFSNNLEGVGSQYIGFLNYYESLQLYTSILSILLIPQAIYSLDKRKKLLLATGCLIILLFLIFPWFARAMNGFQYASYRWGYLVIFCELILLAFLLKTIIEKRAVHYKLLILSAGFIVLSVAFITTYHTHEEIYKYNLYQLKQVSIFVLIYIVGLYLIIRGGVVRQISFVIIISAISFELVYEHRDTLGNNTRSTLIKGFENDRNGELNYGVYLFDDTKTAITFLKKVDNSFFRVEKNRWILSMNDSVVQGYYGLDTYNSLNNPSYLELVEKLDIPRIKGANPITVLGWTSLQRPYLADLLSVKYYLTKDPLVKPKNVRLVKRINDIYIFERLTSLPFGFVYSNYIDRDKFFSLQNAKSRDCLLLKGFIPNPQMIEDSLQGFSEVSYDLSPGNCKPKGNMTAMKINFFKDDHIIGKIELARKGLLFFSIPFDPGWQIKVDGKDVEPEKVNLGFIGISLEKGKHEIELNFSPPWIWKGFFISLFSLILILILTFIDRKKHDVF